VSQQLNDHFFELESDIHLGILSAWDICTSVYETIQSFTTKYPKIHISINSYSFKSLLSNLHCGKLDVIVYIKSCLEREANIVIYPLGQIHRLFAYSPQNPLCFKKNLTALDFKDETFLYHIDDGLDLSNDLLMDTCKRCGFTPATFKVVPNTESMLLEAQEGLGIALVNCMVHTHNLKRFVLTPTSVICMAIRKGDNNPIIRAFINEVLFQQANSPNPEKVYPYIMHKQHPASPASNITTRE
jgi:DNA-binding transcriptional LysR family regulator